VSHSSLPQCGWEESAPDCTANSKEVQSGVDRCNVIIRVRAVTVVLQVHRIATK
ncbi:hypothetical protein L195_g048537, partial [Trifolium pratense]